MDGLVIPPGVGDLSAAALLAFAVLMILTGRIVPRRSLEDMREERDYWRRSALEWQRQASALQVGAEVTTQVLRGLPLPEPDGAPVEAGGRDR